VKFSGVYSGVDVRYASGRVRSVAGFSGLPKYLADNEKRIETDVSS